MKRKIFYLSMVMILGLSMSLSSCGGSKDSGTKNKAPKEMQSAYDSFIKAVNPKVAYDAAVHLSENFLSSDLGGRNAGSDAEHQAADWLVGQMKAVGLTEVTKEGAKCDVWDNRGSSVSIQGDDKTIQAYSYATAATPKDGITAEVVFLGKGTMADYENVDVKGKIVLIDINQREDWWITYPMLEAQLHGAAGIMSANVGGFAQVNKDALNSQDICGPTGIPCVSISVNDSTYIQDKLKNGKVTVNLKVDNIVKTGKTGTTYNIYGKIKGKSSENQIIIGGHYDVHFYGFQDDGCAIGLDLAIAKAMVDSGYQPENDIVFCFHGAEEWGASNTQYDWCVGAWEMINTLHPEWAGKTLAFLNFELPAYEFAKYTSTASPPEMFKMLDFYANTWPLSPKPEGCFPEGVKTAGYPNYTYSDDFSYVAAGVPSTVNGFLLTDDAADVFDFYYNYYHSQDDAKAIYNEKVMDFNIKYYGALAQYIDQMPALYLDYTAQVDRLSAAVNDEIMTSAGADVDGYKKALDGLKTAAAAMTSKVEQVNNDYVKAKIDGDQAAADKLWQEGKALTKQNLAAFGYAQDQFLGLMYEKPIVFHEAAQENIDLINQTVAELEGGNVQKAADDYAWQINNVLEWYSMYFSPEVIAMQNDMFWGKDNQDNLYWGTGRNFVPADVEAATRGLIEKYDTEGADLSKEIAIYNTAKAAQEKVLVQDVDKEVKGIQQLTKMLAL